MKNWKNISIVVISLVLGACGGGGEGASPNNQANDGSAGGFPLAEFDNREKSEPMGIETVETGVVVGVSTFGGQIREQTDGVILTSRRFSNGQFEGAPVKVFFEEIDRKYTVYSGFFINGVPSPGYSFFSENNKAVGGAYVMAYVVATEALPYPEKVFAGDSGVRYKGVVYRDDTKARQIGTVESLWKIDSVDPLREGGNAVAIISVLDTNYDLNGSVRSKVVTTKRLVFTPEFTGFNRLLHAKRVSTVEEYYFGGVSEKFTTQWN